MIKQPEGGATLPGTHLKDANRCRVDRAGKPLPPIFDMRRKIVMSEEVATLFAGTPALQSMAATKGSGSFLKASQHCQLMTQAVVAPVIVNAGVDVGLRHRQGFIRAILLHQGIGEEDGQGRFLPGTAQLPQRFNNTGSIPVGQPLLKLSVKFP